MREGFVTKKKAIPTKNLSPTTNLSPTDYYCAEWMGNKHMSNLQTGTECSILKDGMIIQNLEGRYIVFQATGNSQYPVQKCESFSYELGPQNCEPYKA
jgi:hypothetical protein